MLGGRTLAAQDNMPPPGQVLIERLDAIAAASEPGPGVTRLPFTPQHRQAAEIIATWMAKAGLHVHTDVAGTLIGTRPGPAGAPTLLFGSHQDSIRQGGRFDGILGVALPILVLERIRRLELPYAVQVLAFADEEGVRFPTALMGPRSLAGTFDPSVLSLRDRDGVALGEALTAFGGKPPLIESLRREPGDLLGYVETHIEQGPLLESEDLPVGIVTGICGIERWTVTLVGATGHAGTVPMHLRHDALTGASEIALELESLCRGTEDLVGVVGSFSIQPDVVNGIPGQVRFSVELRSPDDAIRSAAAEAMAARIEAIVDRRGLTATIEKTYAQRGVACDAGLTDRLAEAVADTGITPRHLMSGATHDASAMADITPVAMLFVRCTGGISHSPEEAVLPEDLDVACEVLVNFLERQAEALRS